MALQEREISSSSINDKQEQNSNRVITIVFLALFIDLLGFALILPLFPSILDYYSQTGVSNKVSLLKILVTRSLGKDGRNIPCLEENQIAGGRIIISSIFKWCIN